MRLIIAATILLILSISVFAQVPEENIAPPALPTGDEEDLTLYLYDSDTQEVVTDLHARITLEGKYNKSTLKFVEDGRLKLKIEPGSWKLTVLIDDIKTPGKDYTYRSGIRIKSAASEKVFLVPSGSVQGTVYENSQAVSDAEINLYCSSSDEVISTKTDSSGAFSADWLPIGQCRITTATESERGESQVNITKGGISIVNIELSEGLSGFRIWPYASIILVLLSIILLLLRLSKKPKISRADDIKKTLNEKESIIVNFLLSNNNKGTQATIKNETGIPKTSLLRIFQSLESRNIISIEKIGKMKKIKLTAWFLGRGKLDRNSTADNQNKA
jgi:uncharacterized membrane protein